MRRFHSEKEISDAPQRLISLYKKTIIHLFGDLLFSYLANGCGMTLSKHWAS